MNRKLAGSRALVRWRERGNGGQAAFTVIELLVVIAIIAILAAMLLPALNRAKLASDSAVCRSNLHQIMVAMRLYAQDYGAYPLANSWPAELQPFARTPWPARNYDIKQSQGTTWFSYLGPASGLYACPAYNRLRGAFGPLGGEEWAFVRGSYGYNAWGDFEMGSPLGLGGYGGLSIREDNVACPSDMIGVADGTLFNAPESNDGTPLCGHLFLDTLFTYGHMYSQVIRGVPANDPAVQGMKRRHGGKWMVGFCDGHIESLGSKSLFDLSNPTVAQRWNSDHQPHSDDWTPPLP